MQNNGFQMLSPKLKKPVKASRAKGLGPVVIPNIHNPIFHISNAFTTVSACK
jgi:hypothetical protein